VYVSFHKLNQIQVTMTSVNLILDAAQILEDEEEKHNNIVTWNTPINPMQNLDQIAPLNAYKLAMETIEYEMWTTYSLPVTFLDAFVKHASNRTTEQIKNNEYLLPDGFMDKNVLHKQIMDTVAEYNVHTEQLRQVAHDTLEKLEEISFNERAQSLGPRAISETLIDFSNEKHDILERFSLHVNHIYGLRHKLSMLADVKSIDAKIFYCKMHEWQLNYTILKMKMRFPDLIS
jgi:hypothetical protein